MQKVTHNIVSKYCDENGNYSDDHSVVYLYNRKWDLYKMFEMDKMGINRQNIDETLPIEYKLTDFGEHFRRMFI